MKKKIKIHFDSIIYSLQSKGGITTYWKQLTKKIFETSLFDLTETFSQKYSRFFLVYTKSHIFHSSYYRLPVSLFKKVIQIITIHDLMYEMNIVKTFFFNRIVILFQRKLAIKNANAIICVSENTKNDFIKHYPFVEREKIYVIYHGIDKIKPIVEIDFSQKTYTLIRERKFLLFLGSRASYKNFTASVLGFAESKIWQQDFKLICIGQDLNLSEQEFVASVLPPDAFLALSNISNQELCWFFYYAHCLLYPSSYEGFGFPPLEALQYDCPSIVVNTSCLPEILEKAAYFIETPSIYNISTGIMALFDPKIRNDILIHKDKILSKYTWENSIKKHLELYNSLLKYDD